MQKSTVTWAAAAAATLGAAVAGAAYAQFVAGKHDALKRTILERFDVPDSKYETIVGTSELGPDEHVGAQTHPGPEGGYVLEGSGTMVLDGGKTLELKPGMSYKLAPGAAHATSSGPEGVKLLVVWVVEKGKPMTSEVK